MVMVVMLVTMSVPVNMIHGIVVVLVRMGFTQQEPHGSDHQGTGAKVLEKQWLGQELPGRK